MFEFELGEILKDRVSGFQGVVMARTEYFTGCVHYGLCSQSLKDNRPIDWEWFDETRLDKVKGKKRVEIGPRSKVTTSGVEPCAPMVG